MTTTVKWAIAAGLALLATPALAVEECPQMSAAEQNACLAALIATAQTTLDADYRAVLAKMPDADPTDIRKSKAQLTKAQAAWQAYIDAECDYVGGAQGGSNGWVTNFAARCRLQSVRERIGVLTHLPASDGAAG